MILSLLSILGYFLIFIESKYSYLVFIIQNFVAFLITKEWYMIVNIVFCILFFIFKSKKEKVCQSLKRLKQ